MFTVWGSTYIPAFEDEMVVDFTSFDTRENAEAWIEDNSWTGIEFHISEAN